MTKYRLATAAVRLIAAATLSACAGSIGTTQTDTINVPMPANKIQTWDVELDLGTASVSVGSSGESLVHGSVEYNVPALKPAVTIGDRSVVVRQEFSGILPVNTRNDWRLQLGRDLPMNLTVNTGASSGKWELGGLSLRRLAWTQGAADATLHFSEPNPVELDSLTINGGAASLTVRGLANSNIRSANVTAGAGAITLYFDGALSQNASITLDGGVSSIAIYSGGNPIQVTLDSKLNAIQNSGWQESGNTYSSPEWATAGGPKIAIRARLGIASLNLIAGQ
jgi:hypothetical protein